MSAFFDSLLTLAAGVVLGAACSAVADAIDPVGAEARHDLTDDKIAAFLQAQAV